MSWGVLNTAMLVGLVSAAVPVIIHFLNRRRDQVVDWGAMQFLELGKRARQKIRLTELLLMLARIGLLAAVALAMARPFWVRSATADAHDGAWATSTPPRDVVIVFDGSASMDRKLGGTTPRAEAIAWARQFVARLRPGDSTAVLIAGDRIRSLVDPPSFDKARVDSALSEIKPGRGSSDLPAALAEAFRILERTQNPGRDVIVLTDGQRHPWHPGEPKRWSLLRELRTRIAVPPRLWSVAFGRGREPEEANGGIGPIELSRALLTPGLPVTATTTITNDGPGSLTRTAELLIDGRAAAGSARVVGPVPASGKMPVTFRTVLATPGSHLVTIRFAGGGDALPADDEASAAVEVAEALPVLLVDGEPSLEPLGGETDFLRAALAPSGDETPQVRTRTIAIGALTPDSLKGQRVVVLANVERLTLSQTASLGRFVDAGGGLLIAPGDRTDPEPFNNLPFTPAALGAMKGDLSAKQPVAHPAPRTFNGPLMAPFAVGEAPALGSVSFFAYRVLSPAPGASIAARFETGDPWVVERSLGQGRVILLAAPVDAEGGTLPVNPDYVPLVHEWVFHLAKGVSAQTPLRPGEPLVFDLDPPPDESVKTLPLVTPDGTTVQASVVRVSGSTRARFDEASVPGVYRLTLPAPPGGFLYATVASDARESDLTPLEPAEAARLAEGWPLEFAPDPATLTARLFQTGPGGRHELWRGLVLAALAALCLEIWLTRRLARGQLESV